MLESEKNISLNRSKVVLENRTIFIDVEVYYCTKVLYLVHSIVYVVDCRRSEEMAVHLSSSIYGTNVP